MYYLLGLWWKEGVAAHTLGGWVFKRSHRTHRWPTKFGHTESFLDTVWVSESHCREKWRLWLYREKKLWGLPEGSGLLYERLRVGGSIRAYGLTVQTRKKQNKTNNSLTQKTPLAQRSQRKDKPSVIILLLNDTTFGCLHIWKCIKSSWYAVAPKLGRQRADLLLPCCGRAWWQSNLNSQDRTCYSPHSFSIFCLQNRKWWL